MTDADLQARLRASEAVQVETRTALEPVAFCEDVQHKPAEYVTREMAVDAGEPTMAGTLLRGEVSEPCGTCRGCRIHAALSSSGSGLLDAVNVGAEALRGVEEIAKVDYEDGIACRICDMGAPDAHDFWCPVPNARAALKKLEPYK